MYGVIWRILPGPVWVKTVLAIFLVLAVIVALFLWIFPAIAPLLPFDQQTVEEATG